MQGCGGGNYVSRSSLLGIPRELILVDGTSKLLPHGILEGMAVVTMTHDAYWRIGAQYEKFVARTCFDTPSTPGLWVIAETLGSYWLGEYHHAVSALIDKNYQYVEQKLTAIGLGPADLDLDGYHVWIRIMRNTTLSSESVSQKLMNAGISARHSREYNQSGEDGSVWIRFPIHRSTSKVQEITELLSDRLRRTSLLGF